MIVALLLDGVAVAATIVLVGGTAVLVGVAVGGTAVLVGASVGVSVGGTAKQTALTPAW